MRSGIKLLCWSFVLVSCLSSAEGKPPTADKKLELNSFLFPEEVNPLKPRSRERKSLVALVQHKNKIVYERSAENFSSTQAFLLWSISKSITNLAMGVAEQKGVLSMDQSIEDFFPESSYRYKAELRLQDILWWSSGIFFREKYEFAPLRSDVVAMLYTIGRQDMAQYLLSRKPAAKPGHRYNYSTGDTSLLMAALQRALGDQTASSFIQEHLFEPLKIRSAVWESDGTGVPIGGASLYMSARDLAKLGQLIIEKGVWRGDRILPPDWIDRSVEIAPAYRQSPARLKSGFGSPAQHWWVNQEVPEREIQRAWPSAPEDTMVAQGHWGQLLVIIPSRELVAVRFADELYGATSIEAFIAEVLKLISEEEALPL